MGADSSLADLQDSTGGITLYFPSRALLAGRFHRGDEVRVSGIIEQYEGQTEILVRHIERLGPGTLPAPLDVLAADLLGTRYLGQLVRVEGKVSFKKDTRGQREIVLSDRSGQLPIYVGNLLLQDPEFDRRLLAGGRRATVVGIAAYSQPENGPVTQSGYRLIARGPADFTFRPVPPYRLIASGLTLMVALLAGFYLVLRKRRAERRVRETALLLENLNQSEKALRQSEQRYRLLFDHNLAEIGRAHV